MALYCNVNKVIDSRNANHDDYIICNSMHAKYDICDNGDIACMWMLMIMMVLTIMQKQPGSATRENLPQFSIIAACFSCTNATPGIQVLSTHPIRLKLFVVAILLRRI